MTAPELDAWMNELNTQETAGVVAVWLQPHVGDVEACLIAETVSGPKPYMRMWLNKPGVSVEWGWVLHESAVELWRMPGFERD